MTRIVAINGDKVPGERGVAEGANKVSLLPGYYELKILYVHGAAEIDYYSYSVLPVILNANCSYKIMTNWSSLDRTILFRLVGTPSVPGGNLDCGSGITEKRNREILL